MSTCELHFFVSKEFYRFCARLAQRTIYGIRDIYLYSREQKYRSGETNNNAWMCVLVIVTIGAKNALVSHLAWNQFLSSSQSARRFCFTAFLGKNLNICNTHLGRFRNDVRSFVWFFAELRRFSSHTSFQSLIHRLLIVTKLTNAPANTNFKASRKPPNTCCKIICCNFCSFWGNGGRHKLIKICVKSVSIRNFQFTVEQAL